ncbi:MAG: hypothetical protein M3015_08190 [Bacteroidota bacterium]|nr:hypothetical protein [Bacteroidota bacterium]
MKKILLSLCIVLSLQAKSQVHSAMPPEANEFFDKAMPLINPSVKNLITQSAITLKNRHTNADSLFSALRSNRLLKAMNDENIAGITTLVMVQASKNADEDLKKMVLSMKNDNAAAQAGNNHEEANDKKQLALQLILNRKSNMAEEISLVLKKIPQDKDNIINSLK